MSNTKKATGVGRRYVARHRKDPSWTVGDLAAASSGLGAKIAVAGLAGVALVLPATSAFAARSSLPAGSMSGPRLQLDGSGSAHVLADVIKGTTPPTAATGGAPVTVDGIDLSADPTLISQLQAAAATGTPLTVGGITIDPDSPLITRILSAASNSTATPQTATATPANAAAPSTAAATGAGASAPVVADGINISADPTLISQLQAAAATGTPVTVDGITIDPGSPLVTQILAAAERNSAAAPPASVTTPAAGAPDLVGGIGPGLIGQLQAAAATGTPVAIGGITIDADSPLVTQFLSAVDGTAPTKPATAAAPSTTTTAAPGAAVTVGGITISPDSPLITRILSPASNSVAAPQTATAAAPSTAAATGAGARMIVDGISLNADPGLVSQLQAAATTGTPVTIDGVTISPDSPLITQLLSAAGGTAPTKPASAAAPSTPGEVG
jgi:hypothetical protein